MQPDANSKKKCLAAQCNNGYLLCVSKRQEDASLKQPDDDDGDAMQIEAISSSRSLQSKMTNSTKQIVIALLAVLPFYRNRLSIGGLLVPILVGTNALAALPSLNRWSSSLLFHRCSSNGYGTFPLQCP